MSLPEEEAIHHDKVVILDDCLVITGSYNFSEHAEANGENILFIRSCEVAANSRNFNSTYVYYGSPRGLEADASRSG